MLSLYDAAQKELVFAAPPPDQARVAAAVGSFFRELLSPFEMSFRGYQEANHELSRLNEDLKAAYAALQAKQLQLVQSAKMASLGELVAGIAHEINNPLAFVLNHLKTVEVGLSKIEGELPELSTPAMAGNWQRMRSRLQESRRGAERIRNLVLKLRTFSRLDEGEEKQVSVSESVLSVLTILEHRYKDRIQVTTCFGDPDLIECFPGLLNQAIMNLVANAIEAIPEQGSVSITTGAEGDSYIIAVADSGVGIPDELRERVIEPFFTTKPVGEGTGLGLSITYSIVQKHRGTLVLTSGPGGGTVATIRFPMRLP
ncbi:MAG TPA: ATP-binding protein [Polyangiaceae bacterium]|nr:ATP-binding protein [Polyangiaceae bacterium]